MKKLNLIKGTQRDSQTKKDRRTERRGSDEVIGSDTRGQAHKRAGSANSQSGMVSGGGGIFPVTAPLGGKKKRKRKKRVNRPSEGSAIAVQLPRVPGPVRRAQPQVG